MLNLSGKQNTSLSRLLKTTGGAISFALFTVLIATSLTPVSSAVTDGGFFVKAQNSENPQIQAFAGVQKTPFEPGGDHLKGEMTFS